MLFCEDSPGVVVGGEPPRASKGGAEAPVPLPRLQAKKLFESVPPPVGASGLEVLLCRIAVAVFPGKGDPGASVSPLLRCLPSEAVLGVRYAQTRQLRTARHSPSAAYDIMAPIDGVGVGHAAGMPRPRALLDASSPATEGRAPRPHSRTDGTASRRKGPLISAAGIANSAAVPDEKQSHDVDDVRSRGNRASSGPAAVMAGARLQRSSCKDAVARVGLQGRGCKGWAAGARLQGRCPPAPPPHPQRPVDASELLCSLFTPPAGSCWSGGNGGVGAPR